MITKITMNKVASFKAPTVIETIAPINLLYGLNGSGKTTISKFLNNIAGEAFQECKIEKSESGDLSLRVYNQSFVDDVFYSQDTQKGIFTLSKENKSAEQKIVLASEQLAQFKTSEEQLTRKCSEKANEIALLTAKAQDACFTTKQRHTGGDRILDEADFLRGFKTKAPLFSHLLGTKPSDTVRSVEEIKKDVELLSKSDSEDINRLPEISGAQVLLQIESASIFSETIVGKANSSLSGLIVHLSNSSWFAQGIEYLEKADGVCPFCQQSMSEQLTREINSYFDESYKSKKFEIDKMKASYMSAIGAYPDWGIYESCPVLTDVGNLKVRYDALLSKLKSNFREIESKLNDPGKTITLFSTSDSLIEFNKLIASANFNIDEHNKKIANKKDALGQLKVDFWQNQRKEHDLIITRYKDSLKHLENDQSDLSIKLTECKEKIVETIAKLAQLQKETINIDETISSINALLEDCGLVGFNIVKEGDRYYRIAREDDDSKNKVFATLSEGDKTMISFFYFLEMCRGKQDPSETGKKIIVIDDPISSLSHMYVFNVARLIKKEFTNLKVVNKEEGIPVEWSLVNANRYSQCFILTHSLYFFYELCDMDHKRRKAMQKLFRVKKSLNGSQVVEMGYSEVQNDYQSYWSIIKDESSHPALLANSMRNVIEYFFGFIEKMELSNVFPPDLDDMKHQMFYRYMNRESHSFANNLFDTKEFDYTLFQDAFKLVFTRAGYADHYNKMMK
jgi:wobble nucleotide-excising tRNase